MLTCCLLLCGGVWGQKKQVLHDDQEGVRYLTQLRLSDR